MNLPSDQTPKAEHFDVLIVGAGITGIGGAYHLTRQCPEKTFAVLEAMESFGGTWLMHKYPGIRSDSDLYTFGYRFKPWLGAPIASAAEIRKYMGEVIEENDLARHIRFNHHVAMASWSSEDSLWTIEGVRKDTEEPVRFTCGFLWMCQGYYRHGQGYTPDWPDMDRFEGRIVHPQTWPEDLEYKDKRVVVIGSGATAATLVPAMADDCAHVTLLQRSPTYFFPGRNRNRLADMLRELDIDETWIHEIVRRKIVFDQRLFVHRALNEPDAAKQDLLGGVAAYLPEDEVARHFTPTYKPWRQRIAYVPDGDLFESLKSGKASVVTDHIDRFIPKGIRLKSGQNLEADIVVTATGFNMNVMGDIAFTVDDRPVNFADTVTYRGMMFTGVPNMLWVLGYFRGASWTLKADLVSDFVCRLLNHMSERGAAKVTVALRPEDEGMPLAAWIDPDSFNPGYLQRGVHLLPKRGDKPEWAHSQDYWWEKDELARADLGDPVFLYEPSRRGR
ncbi:MAG TPA: NAD(P)/FAD-dependent oxidoreductase [Caulobacteraceae bacterium]|jgi:cation diffusion facilitator CzcD-associated flavoprotein CzcO